MAKKKSQPIVVDIKGLPYSKKLDNILLYINVGIFVLCLLTLVLPIIRFWYPLTSNPVYSNFMVNGYYFIFGGKVSQFMPNDKSSSSYLTTVPVDVIWIAYLVLILAIAIYIIVVCHKNAVFKKIGYLISSLCCAASASLFAMGAEVSLKAFKNISGISNTIRNVEFSFFGILFIVLLAISFLLQLYQASCIKIVKK